MSLDPMDLAFLEDRMARAAVDAAGVGDEKEFAVVVRKDGQSSPEVRSHVGRGLSASCRVGRRDTQERWYRPSADGGSGAEAKLRGCRLVMGLTYDVLIGDFYDRLDTERSVS